MKICKMVVFGFFLVMVIVGCGRHIRGGATFKSNPAAEQAAIKATQAWLALVDKGRYAESWQQAAVAFKSTVSQTYWERAVWATRHPLGRVISRKIESRQFITRLPWTPPGQYVVIQFDTVFKNRANVQETITPMLEKDGQWKVSAYYVR
jgi:hypothetical protein